jgi:hypothetical protein
MPLTRCGAVPGSGHGAARGSGAWKCVSLHPRPPAVCRMTAASLPAAGPGKEAAVAAPAENPGICASSRQPMNLGFSGTFPPRRRSGRNLPSAAPWTRFGGAPRQVPHPLHAREPATPTPGFLGLVRPIMFVARW